MERDFSEQTKKLKEEWHDKDFIIVNDGKRNKVKRVGLVIYADKGYYEKIKNESLPKIMPITNNEALVAIQKLFGSKIEQTLIEYKHEGVEGKFYYQCIIIFKKMYNIYKKSGTFYDGEKKCIYMFQNTINKYALSNYCKKEHDFKYLYENLIFETKNDIIPNSYLELYEKNRFETDKSYAFKTNTNSTETASNKQINELLAIIQNKDKKINEIMERSIKNEEIIESNKTNIENWKRLAEKYRKAFEKIEDFKSLLKF